MHDDSHRIAKLPRTHVSQETKSEVDVIEETPPPSPVRADESPMEAISQSEEEIIAEAFASEQEQEQDDDDYIEVVPASSEQATQILAAEGKHETFDEDDASLTPKLGTVLTRKVHFHDLVFQLLPEEMQEAGFDFIQQLASICMNHDEYKASVAYPLVFQCTPIPAKKPGQLVGIQGERSQMRLICSLHAGRHVYTLSNESTMNPDYKDLAARLAACNTVLARNEDPINYNLWNTMFKLMCLAIPDQLFEQRQQIWKPKPDLCIQLQKHWWAETVED